MLGDRVTELSDLLNVSSKVVVFVEQERDIVREREGSNGNAKLIVCVWTIAPA